jgi:hypothetical protein
MLVAPIEGSASAPERAEKPDILSAALSAATRAATMPVAMKWSSRSLKAGELPAELTKNRAHLAIYLLPRAFVSLGCPMASEFAELWQFGGSKKRRIERISRPYPKAPLLICRYALSEFGGSDTMKSVINRVLQKAIDTLPQMASIDTALDERWQELRRIAKETAGRRKKDDQWSEATPSFSGMLENPVIRVETRAISTETFIANGESPLNSDAYGAIGPFAARAYLEAVLSKRTGDNRIFVKPTRVGVRIWDDYDYNDFDDPDSKKAQLLSKVFGRLTSQSQFLGFWNDTDTDDVVVLRNSDFRSFREEFMPIYNSQNPAPARKMTCEDYSSVSDYIVQMVEGGAEYPLPGITS